MNQVGRQDIGDEERHAASMQASWAAWETYYKQASRRRRSSGGRRHLREEKRRRRIRERVGIAVSTVVVLALTFVFYAILR
jgi:hypothetical protein